MEATTLAQLRSFVSAYDQGSLTAAARRLSVSQASVSEHIARLEENLNAVLFVRNSRGLTPTAAAQELISHSRAALGAIEAGTSAVRSLSNLEGGVASFGALRYASNYGLSDLVLRFHKRYPKVRIRVVGVNSDFVARSVRAGRLEAGVVVLPVDVDGLTVTPIARDQVFFGSMKRGPEDGPVTIEELAASDLVLFDADAGHRDPTRRQLHERALRKGLNIQADVEVELADTAAELVAAGAGGSIFARSLTMGPFPPNIRISPMHPPMYDTLAIVTRKDSYLSSATMRFSRMAEAAILSHFARLGGDDWRVR